MATEETDSARELREQVYALCAERDVSAIAGAFAALCQERADTACEDGRYARAIAWTVARQRFEQAAASAHEAEQKGG